MLQCNNCHYFIRLFIINAVSIDLVARRHFIALDLAFVYILTHNLITHASSLTLTPTYDQCTDTTRMTAGPIDALYYKQYNISIDAIKYMTIIPLLHAFSPFRATCRVYKYVNIKNTIRIQRDSPQYRGTHPNTEGLTPIIIIIIINN